MLGKIDNFLIEIMVLIPSEEFRYFIREWNFQYVAFLQVRDPQVSVLGSVVLGKYFEHVGT